jgi:large subunit ribosomal protein L15
MFLRALTHLARTKAAVNGGAIPKDFLSRRFALTRRPFLPLCASNLRAGHGDLVVRKKHRKKIGRGKAGHSVNSRIGQGGNPHPGSWDGGKVPLYRRFPKWPSAKLRSKRPALEQLNISKLRYFIEKGRLDARYPITIRHLRDSGCVLAVKHGIKIFNVNDYPFPYKIDLEVSGADQSSIDAIKRVGGSVTIVHFDRVGLRAHLRPWRFAVLPKSARPSVGVVSYLEKMRLRGCRVRYVRPQWLLEEEAKVKRQLLEENAENVNLAQRSSKVL